MVDYPTEEQWAKLTTVQRGYVKDAVDNPEKTMADMAKERGISGQAVGEMFKVVEKRTSFTVPQRLKRRRGRRASADRIPKPKQVKLEELDIFALSYGFGQAGFYDYKAVLEENLQFKARLNSLSQTEKRNGWLEKENEKLRTVIAELQQKGGVPGIGRLESGWLEDLDPYVAQAVRTIAGIHSVLSKRNFPSLLSIIPTTISVPTPSLCYN